MVTLNEVINKFKQFFVLKTEIVNNLSSKDSTKVLSAKQGNVLELKIIEIREILGGNDG